MGFLEEAEDDEEEDEVVEAEVIEAESTAQDTSDKPSNQMLQPVTDDLDEIARVYQTYEEVKTKLLGKNDTETVNGNAFITKSGFRKIAAAFNVSIETIKSKRTVNDGIVRYEVVAKATAPNGKSATGIGMAGSNESNFMDYVDDEYDEERPEEGVYMIDQKLRRLRDPKRINEHNLHTLAETRAKNRAISDVVGGGDVSAEEMDSEKFF